jgi:hypothetical protein
MASRAVHPSLVCSRVISKTNSVLTLLLLPALPSLQMLLPAVNAMQHCSALPSMLMCAVSASHAACICLHTQHRLFTVQSRDSKRCCVCIGLIADAAASSRLPRASRQQWHLLQWGRQAAWHSAAGGARGVPVVTWAVPGVVSAAEGTEGAQSACCFGRHR